jgi:hypothetical protein
MIQKLLLGHTSPETAFVVDDYPYGFRLRCKIRYWIEHRPKFGSRFGSQTTNPKRGDVWNAPKFGTYSDYLFMGFDEEGHVVNDAVRYYDKPEKILHLRKLVEETGDSEQITRLKALEQLGRKYNPKEWEGK